MFAVRRLLTSFFASPASTSIVRQLLLELRFGERRLVSPLPFTTQVAGFKTKHPPKLRCPSCYFKRINGRLYVLCKEHGRHKQREPFPNIKLLW